VYPLSSTAGFRNFAFYLKEKAWHLAASRQSGFIKKKDLRSQKTRCIVGEDSGE
jgi:uncharacterized membrane protein